MAFFLRENARDDFNAKPHGRAMKFHNTDNSPYRGDEREAMKEEAAKAMESYQNPLHCPTYDPMISYGNERKKERATRNGSYVNNNNNRNNNNNSSNENSPSSLKYQQQQRHDGDGNDDYETHSYGGGGGGDSPHQYQQQQHQPPQRSHTSHELHMHMREERPMMASKKMVINSDGTNGGDFVRRGNGNIIAPQPLSWEEAKPKLRSHHKQLPDSVLMTITNRDDEYKDSQIQRMAKCGQGNFYKGFSNKPDKAVGTHKVPQEALHSNGIGIWGFGGMGKMSEESTGGMRYNPNNNSSSSAMASNSGSGINLRAQNHQLQPLESQQSLQNKLLNNNNNGNFNNGDRSQSPNSLQQQQFNAYMKVNNNANNSNNYGGKYDDRPWARPTDLQAQKLQNGFSDVATSNNNRNNGGGGNSPYRSQQQTMPQHHHNVRGDKNASVVRECLNYAHDKSSTDVTLRQRQSRYPDPSTVPMNEMSANVVFKQRGAGGDGLHHGHGKAIPYNAPSRHTGGTTNSRIFGENDFISQGNMMASPPGAKLASRSETTNGASYLAPRSQTSFN